MASILFVVQNKNFITSALALQLERQGHTIYVANNDVNKINEVKDHINMLLVCVDNKAMDDLSYVKDCVVEKDIPVMVIGGDNALREIASIIPLQFVKKHFLKPINISEITKFIGAYQAQMATQPKKVILVVDDSGAMLRNIKGWLEDKYQVVLANSGAAAIKSLAIKRPDLILLDYEMPVCDGKQVLEMIRAEAEYADIPVMFLTSKSDKESVESVTELKPEGYLIKVMEPRCIVQSIDGFFKREEIKNLRR